MKTYQDATTLSNSTETYHLPSFNKLSFLVNPNPTITVKYRITTGGEWIEHQVFTEKSVDYLVGKIVELQFEGTGKIEISYD